MSVFFGIYLSAFSIVFVSAEIVRHLLKQKFTQLLNKNFLKILFCKKKLKDDGIVNYFYNSPAGISLIRKK
jgi:hypothetical protein